MFDGVMESSLSHRSGNITDNKTDLLINYKLIAIKQRIYCLMAKVINYYLQVTTVIVGSEKDTAGVTSYLTKHLVASLTPVLNV